MKSNKFRVERNISSACILGIWLMVLFVARPGRSSDATMGKPASGIFERTEPNLADGMRALEDGRPEDALRAFRQAQTETQDERAVVEYDVGQALLQQGISEAEASEQNKDGAQGNAGQQVFDEAAEAFERAYGLTNEPRLKSVAAQAAGNARAQKGDLQGAVDSFRKAIIADPKNVGARKNLASVLRALAAQPPPPPSESSEQSESENDSEKDQQDGNQKQNKDSSSPDKKEEDKQPQPGENPENQPSSEQGDKKNEGEKKDSSSGADEKPDSKSTEGQNPEETAPQKERDTGAYPPEDRSKEQAQRLLDQMRNREKPLVPLWMRGKSSSKPPPEKDW